VKTIIRGIISGPIAPFTPQDELDEQALRGHINWLIDGGVHVLLAGTIVAEFPSLSFEERKVLINTLVDETNGRVPVFSAAGGSDHKQALALIRHGEDTGVDGIFLIPPYLYTLSQEEIYDHTKSLCEATDLPVLIYNTPAANISPGTYRRLVEKVDNISGVKESNQSQLLDVVNSVGDKIAVLTSKDPQTLESLIYGAKGCASILSAIAPRKTVDLYEAFERKDLMKAAEIQRETIALGSFLVSEGISAPLKAGLEMLGMRGGPVRKPHLPISSEKKEVLRSMLRDLGLLEG
jgi:4-hydroxy-tetrahydrodipicolinate synthase